MEFYSILCDSLDGKGVQVRMDARMHMDESLHCSSENYNIVNWLNTKQKV